MLAFVESLLSINCKISPCKSVNLYLSPSLMENNCTFMQLFINLCLSLHLYFIYYYTRVSLTPSQWLFLSLIFKRMKFSTLLAASMLLCSSLTVSAVETDKLHGSLDFNNVLASGAAQVNAPMAFTSDGNVLVTSTQYKNMQLSSFEIGRAHV